MISSTQRIELSKKVVPPKATINFPDEFRFGCEFEFYINGDNTEAIINELKDITGSDILVNLTELPLEADRNHCLCFKYDASLGDQGVEISTPICSYDTLVYYIARITMIIEDFGSTNEDTGFHIHISIEKKDDIDFYAFILLCNDANLLSNWGERNGYSLNPMEILNNLNEKDTRKLKNKKGRVWSIERRGIGHVEIRTIGGTSYHYEATKICQELNHFIKIFKRCLCDMKMDSEYKTLLQNHLDILENTSLEKKKKFHDFVRTIKPIQE